MSTIRSLAAALFTAAAALVIVLGASSLSLAEGFALAEAPTAPAETAPVMTAVPGETAIATPAPSATPLPKLVTATPLPGCLHPKGWNPYVVRVGDTVFWLASAFNTTVNEIKSANCLTSESLIPGSELYLPALPVTVTAARTPTLTPTVCVPPYGWVQYTVRSGDTYFGFTHIYGLSLDQLLAANCTTSYSLFAGTTIYLPYYPPQPPVPPTWTSSPIPTTETAVPTETTVTVEPPTAEPTASATPDLSSPTVSVPSEEPTIGATAGSASSPVPPAETSPAP